MTKGIEFLLGLVEQRPPARVAWEDFEGECSALLRACQEEGFLGRESLLDPVPSCPHCGEGVPYRLGGRYRCNRCRSAVAPRHLQCWQLDEAAFWGWLASRLHLRGGVRAVEERLWHLGAWGEGDDLHECFYRRSGELSDRSTARLAAYRNVVVLHGLPRPAESEGAAVRWVPLLTVLRWDGALAVNNLRVLLRPQGRIRFDAHTGTLWAGDARLGEVPPGSKECFFLDCLVRHLDRFVPYADLKREVLRRSGSRDAMDEATFCHSLKSRIKKKYVAQIDRLLIATNKADGYRLRGFLEA